MYNDNKKVVIIGVGMVGMSYAYALLNQNICDELVLIDINEERARGEAADLNHGLPFASSSMKIYSGDYSECYNADLVVICAGAPQKDGESRRDLLNKNYKIFESIIKSVVNSGFDGVFLVASNPVDVMTYAVKKISEFPPNKVIGSGTALDSARLRFMMSERFEIAPGNVHAYVLGEHGDSEFVAWSNAFISVNPLSDLIAKNHKLLNELDEIADDVKNSAYEIIKAKRATYYGIGMVLARITRAILFNENSVFTVSAYLNGEYSEEDLYIGVPCKINREGISQILQMELDEEEKSLFKASSDIIKQMISEIE